jgi:hypothetical protein
MEINRVKNDMKLIMESWRSKATLMEADAHSNDWISQINVSQFLNALRENNNEVLNVEVIKKGLNAAMKRYGNEIAALEGEEKSKFDTIISKAMSADAVDVLADFAVEQAEDATKAVGAIAGAKVGAVAGSVLGPAGALAGGVAGAVVGWASSRIVGSVAKKGIKMAQDIGGALEDLDVPDQELANNKALNLIDISDEYKKVIIGADGELDKKEAAVLAIGFRRVAEAYDKISEKNEAIRNMPSETVQDLIAQMTAQRTLLTQPMSMYMGDTATEAARKAYGKMLDLKRNVTINKN